jgi:hypothetical protein
VETLERRAIAFEGTRRLAEGDLATVARAVKEVAGRGETGPLLVFDTASSQPIEFDLRGSEDDVVARMTVDAPTAPESEPTVEEARRGPGRPKLGVVAREVTLLPRHWEWLATQPGGASVVLRRLVDDARKGSEGRDRMRIGRESAYRFMSAMAGNEPGFEEATRALFAGDRARFAAATEAWPPDVRAHVGTLCAAAFEDGA